MYENYYRSDRPMDDLDELNQYLNNMPNDLDNKMSANDTAYANNNYNSGHWQYSNNASLQSNAFNASAGQYGSDQYWCANQRPKSVHRSNNNKNDSFMTDYYGNGRQHQQLWRNQQYIDPRFGMDKRAYFKQNEYSTQRSSPMFDCVNLNSTNNFNANEYNNNKHYDNNYYLSTKEKQYELNILDGNKLNNDLWSLNGNYGMDSELELLGMDNYEFVSPFVTSHSLASCSSTQSSQSSTHTTTSIYSTDDDQSVPNFADLLSKDSMESPNKQSVAKSSVASTESSQIQTIKIDDSEESNKEPITENEQNIGATEKMEISIGDSLQVTRRTDPISKTSIFTVPDPLTGLPVELIKNTISNYKQRTIRPNNKNAVKPESRPRRRKSNTSGDSIEVKRRRNREAAAKCRRKKLKQIEDLEAQKTGLVTEIGPLEQKVIEMRQKVYEMKKWVFRHQIDGCKFETSANKY